MPDSGDSNREALARLINPGAFAPHMPRSRLQDLLQFQENARQLADRILAAGWRPAPPAPEDRS